VQTDLSTPVSYAVSALTSNWFLKTRSELEALTSVATVQDAVTRLHVGDHFESKAEDAETKFVQSRLHLLPQIFALLRVSAFLQAASVSQLVYKEELATASKTFTKLALDYFRDIHVSWLREFALETKYGVEPEACALDLALVYKNTAFLQDPRVQRVLGEWWRGTTSTVSWNPWKVALGANKAWLTRPVARFWVGIVCYLSFLCLATALLLKRVSVDQHGEQALEWVLLWYVVGQVIAELTKLRYMGALRYFRDNW